VPALREWVNSGRSSEKRIIPWLLLLAYYDWDRYEISYKELMLTVEWNDRRRPVLQRDDFTCQTCGRKNELEVHHLKYGKGCLPWEVPDEWLTTLCWACHRSRHPDKMVPKSIVEEVSQSDFRALTNYIDIPNKPSPLATTESESTAEKVNRKPTSIPSKLSGDAAGFPRMSMRKADSNIQRPQARFDYDPNKLPLSDRPEFPRPTRNNEEIHKWAAVAICVGALIFLLVQLLW